MAVPKKKTSKSKKAMRHSHDALEEAPIAYDQDGNIHLSHRATYIAGEKAYYYKGRLVYKLSTKSASES